MEVTPIHLEQYQTPTGTVPFRDWLVSFKDQGTKVIIQRCLARLLSGNLGDFKVFDTITELRIDYGPGYRIYCGEKDQTWVLLLLGGTKRSQARDIQTAKAYWSEYQNRNPG